MLIVHVADVTPIYRNTHRQLLKFHTHSHTRCAQSSQDILVNTAKLVAPQQLQTSKCSSTTRQQITYKATVIEKAALPSS